MWHEPARLAARRVLPQPPAADLAGWLPSARHPSDHLAVVADLEWLLGGPDAGAPAGSDARSVAEPAGPSMSDGAAQAASPTGSRGLSHGGEAGLGGPMPQQRRPSGHVPAAAGSDASGGGAAARGSVGSPARDTGADAAPAGSTERAQESAGAGANRLGGPPSLVLAESPGDAAAAKPLSGSGRLNGGAGAAPVSSGAADAVTPAGAPGAAAAAAAALASGGVVAVPTDTLYGLACDASCAAAVAAIYAIKVGDALHALLPCPRHAVPAGMCRLVRSSFGRPSRRNWQSALHALLSRHPRAQCKTPTDMLLPLHPAPGRWQSAPHASLAPSQASMCAMQTT